MKDIQELIIAQTTALILAKGLPCPAITSQTEFFNDLPIDSLDLATLLVNLELETNIDPFHTGFKTFRSVGELAMLYKDQQ